MSKKNFSLSYYYGVLLPLTRFSIRFYTGVEHPTLTDEAGIRYSVSERGCKDGDIEVSFDDERTSIVGKILLNDGEIKGMEIVTKHSQLDLLEFSKEKELVNVYVHSVLSDITEHQQELKRQKEDIVTTHLTKIRSVLKVKTK